MKPTVPLQIYLFLKSRQAVILLVILWLLVQGILFYHYGIKLVPDSSRRYIPFASSVSYQNLFLDNYNSRYLGYILFLSVFIKAGLSFAWVVLAQIIISGFAAITLYRLANIISGCKAAAFIATFLFIIWKDIQYFNCFILTESLFTSFLLFSYYTVLKAHSPKSIFLAVITVVITCTIRPNGFVVAVAAIIFLFSGGWTQNKLSKTTLIGLIIIFMVLGLVLLNSWLHRSFDLVGEYVKGEIIYGDARFAIPVPAAVWIPETNTLPLLKIWQFIYHNPSYFFRLALTKVIYTLTYIKPYHSGLHKVSSVLIIYPMYFLTLAAFQSTHFKVTHKSFAAAVLITEAFIIAFTVEDWDNRFLIPFIPYLFLFSAMALAGFWTKQTQP